jgi:hypothetical protein
LEHISADSKIILNWALKGTGTSGGSPEHSHHLPSSIK